MKICNRCNEEKPLTDFYKHKKMEDGHLNQCKECKKKQSIEIRNNDIEHYREYDRNRPNKVERLEKQKEYSRTEKGKEVHKKAINKYRESNPIVYGAHVLVNNALRDGKLTKSSLCENCSISNVKLEAHHCDYSLPLEVLWLCVSCHKEWHKNNTPLNI